MTQYLVIVSTTLDDIPVGLFKDKDTAVTFADTQHWEVAVTDEDVLCLKARLPQAADRVLNDVWSRDHSGYVCTRVLEFGLDGRVAGEVYKVDLD